MAAAGKKPGKNAAGAGADDESRASAFGRSMTFGEHLEELRGCLKISAIAFGAAIVICLCFQDWLTEQIAVWPYERARAILRDGGSVDPGPLQAIAVTERFFFYFKFAMYTAFVLAAPVFLHQMWRFIGAGLYPRERAMVMRVLPYSFLLFLAGVVFGFVVVVPTALVILVDYGSAELFVSGLRADDYLGFFLFMCLILGLVFQLPLVQFVLARFDLVSARTMAEKRRYFILGAVLIAAILTPTGDAVSLGLVSAPILILYEVGILVSRRATPTPAAPDSGGAGEPD